MNKFFSLNKLYPGLLPANSKIRILKNKPVDYKTGF